MQAPPIALALSGLALISCSPSGGLWGQIPGGFSSSSVTDAGIITAANFAVTAEAAALKATGEPARLELVKIKSAKQQVVAGANYVLTLKVMLEGKEKTAQATVWWQAWRKPDPYQLTEWQWK